MNILLGLGKKKMQKFNTCESYNKNCVGIINNKKYICLAPDGDNEIIINSGCQEPLIPYTSDNVNLDVLERFLILISGTSGDGKSLLASLFVDQYETMHNNTKDKLKHRKIFRVSMKPITDDRNFKTLKNIINLPMEEIKNIESIKDIPNNSLFIVDDCDKNKDVYNLLNIIGEHGRERGINLIFITHYNSLLGDSSIYRECNIYITFHNNIHNNRMLENNFKISKTNLKFLKGLNQTLYLFNKTNQTIICNNFCCKLNNLTYDEEEQEQITELLNK